MRGALKLDGIESIDIAVGKKEFSVTYDPSKVTVDRMIRALKEKGEAATVAN